MPPKDASSCPTRVWNSRSLRLCWVAAVTAAAKPGASASTKSFKRATRSVAKVNSYSMKSEVVLVGRGESSRKGSTQDSISQEQTILMPNIDFVIRPRSYSFFALVKTRCCEKRSQSAHAASRAIATIAEAVIQHLTGLLIAPALRSRRTIAVAMPAVTAPIKIPGW